MRGEVDAEKPAGADAISETRVPASAPGGQRERCEPAATRVAVRRPELSNNVTLRGRRAVVAHRDVNFPELGIGGGAAHANAAQAGVLDGVRHKQRRADCAAGRHAGVAVGGAPVPTKTISPAVGCFCAWMWRAKDSACSRFSAVEPGWDAWMAVSSLRRSGSKAVAGVARASARTSITRSLGGQRAQVARARWRGHVHERAVAGARGHPRGGIEDEHMVAAGASRACRSATARWPAAAAPC